MYDKLQIKSLLKEYSVEFLENNFYILQEFNNSESYIIIDKNIINLYPEIFSNFNSDKLILVDAIEINKSPEYALYLTKHLIDKKIKRSSIIISIGGGIVQDLSSFIATILFRGIKWIFIPTTLLSQADSCIGGKSSLNFNGSKNLLGTFNPPNQIFIDLRFLNSLPESEIKSGIGEMLHYYFYSNSNKTNKLIGLYETCLVDRSLLKEFILESLLIKKKMIEIDEFDNGQRKLFNYGHTFGHALEALTNYTINHGQAVTIGMDIANTISYEYNYLDLISYQQMESILKINFPIFNISNYNIDLYFNLLQKDKKNINENLTCILSKGIGKLFIHELPIDNIFRGIIKSYFNNKFN